MVLRALTHMKTFLLGTRILASQPLRSLSQVANLERAFTNFEGRCKVRERVTQKDFVKTFDSLARAVELNGTDQPNVSLYSSMLLRCCGKLMPDTPEKMREALAGNLWHLIKEKNIPVDITHYNSLIRTLTENGTTFDPEKILEEIEQKGLKPDRITYQRLIDQYCHQGNIQGATKLLEKMKESGMELTELTFASLIIGYSKQENPPAIEEMFELMRANRVEPGSKSYAAAIIAQSKLVSKDPDGHTKLLNLFKMAEEDLVSFNLYDTIDLLVNLLPSADTTVANKLLAIARRALSNINARARILECLVALGAHEEASKIYWEQKFSRMALSSGNIGVYWIRAMAKHPGVPIDFVMNECEKLKLEGHNLKAFHSLYFSAAEIGRLDLVRASLVKLAEEIPMRCQYFWPLLAQANGPKEIYEVLENDLNPKMAIPDLLDTFSNWIWPRFSDNPLELMAKGIELGYDQNIMVSSFLNHSAQQDKLMEAIKLISENPIAPTEDHKQKDPEEDDDHKLVNRRQSAETDRSRLVARLVRYVATNTKDPSLVRKTFEMCQLPNAEISRRCLQPLVEVHLINNDFQSALQEYLRIVKEYEVSVCSILLMQHCLMQKDQENLQKIMNANTEVNNEQSSLFDLAISCVKCDKLKQAQKVFSTPGYRVHTNRLYGIARSFVATGDARHLENLIKLSRDLYEVDQEYLYMILLEMYDRTSDAKKVLNLWNSMQEESVEPSSKILIKMAKILEQNGIEAPFQKPSKKVRERVRKEKSTIEKVEE